MRSRSLLLLGALAGFATACEDDDVIARYHATLSGSAERPNAVTTSGTGEFEATLNEDNVLTYAVTWSNLNANTILGHIHGPATVDQSVGVLVDFNAVSSGRTITLGATSGTATGTVDLNVDVTGTITGAEFIDLLNTGMTYVNIHSSAHPAGEIRGQIIRQ
jgi:hypothetical protein